MVLTHPLRPGAEIDLFVDRLSYPDGRGVARSNGIVIFVRGAAPLERGIARITHVHPRYAEADWLRATEPSPHRRSPPCQYFDDCGGCTWQHIDDHAQLAAKQSFVDRMIHELGDAAASAEIRPIKASPKTLRYRNRVQVHFDGQGLGYHSRGTNRIVHIEDCLLAEEPVGSKIGELARSAGKRRDGSDGIANLPRGRIEIAQLRDGRITVRSAQGDPEGAFFAQVNRFLNDQMVIEVRNLARLRSPRVIFDLYSGGGNFGLDLAEIYGKCSPEVTVNLVELSRFNHDLAQAEIKSRSLTNITAQNSDVGKYLSRLDPSVTKNSLVILDPPRPGCAKDVIRQLLRLKVPNLIYVSCSPVSLKRDLLSLLEPQGPYRLTSVSGFDLFPQTPHLELIACLDIASQQPPTN